MELPPLYRGRILNRYQRFLADVELEDGGQITAHCPNTGSMRSCWEPGAPVQVSYDDNPKRKLCWTLERVDMGAGWVGIHTGRPNVAIAEGIKQQRIRTLQGYRTLRREVLCTPTGHPRSRIDIVLGEGSGPDVLVEVKNTTLLDDDTVRFPDAITNRGRKHLDVLLEAVRQGKRGVILFAVNRSEGKCFAPAWAIDPAYSHRLVEVAAAGVEILAIRLRHTLQGIEVGNPIKVDLNQP